MRHSAAAVLVACALVFSSAVAAAAQTRIEPYPGTEGLTWEGDLASRLVEGVDRFLLKKLELSVERRPAFWHRDLSAAGKYDASVEPNRRRLAHILGLRDPRLPFTGMMLDATTDQPALVGRGTGYDVLAVRWPVFRNVRGEGLLAMPSGKPALADVIVVPDADQTPESVMGLAEGLPEAAQFARRLAESGCRVLVPVLVDRQLEPRNGRAQLTSREYLYRPSFELGRHIVGYELQKILALVDWLQKDAAGRDPRIGIFGWGEGGMLALYAAALDKRIDAACISGHFQSRQNIWQEPIDRNVFGLLEQFGDAELATLVAPRTLLIEPARGPELELPGKGGAPARLMSPPLDGVKQEFSRARKLLAGFQFPWNFRIVAESAAGSQPGSVGVLEALLAALRPGAKLAPLAARPTVRRKNFEPAARQQRQIEEIDEDTQWLLRESAYVRAEFMSKLDTGSLERYQDSVEGYRRFFSEDVIGRFDDPLLPPNPRSRKAYEAEKWTGYEVVLDVFPEVFAYGILVVPTNILPGEKRPVVVCQHGLEGRPQDTVKGDHPAYHDFAARLAERGFVTFSPQNLYIFGDRFRTLQRKANPLKKSLFSIMVPQHQQIVNWLKSFPMVDGKRIGFYGLSYGGKSAMRIPSLVTDYCLSICSADFNEWVWKNASTRAPHSYVWTGEYEIFEFDLGSTFNYAEMAALIAPRPFMVERGHFDGVAPDEAVGYEFAKVRHLYSARLHLGDRAEIEWFVGPHTINGQGTFRFLHKHLNWPEP